MPIQQVGVLPFRRRRDHIDVLLVTSRKRRRWICPKGNVEEDLGPEASARREAYEEAGVTGRLLPSPLGIYEHGGGSKTVQVYLLEVDEEHDTWPEVDGRERRWLPVPKARRVVDEIGLRRLLEEAERRLRGRGR